MLFPYFGGKRSAANIVWSVLGDPECYIEPFAGSLAVLLARPEDFKGGTEIVVDLDGLLVNFWRCIATDWHTMDPYLVGPVAEVDITAKHLALLEARPWLTDKMTTDTAFFDPKLAAWWWQGISSWLGSGWGHRPARQRPHIDRSLKGIWATGMTDDKISWVASRIANAIILSGNWDTAWTRSATAAIIRRYEKGRGVGVFLDPPYTGDRQKGLYAEDAPLRDQILQWCHEQETRPWCRVALAGYDDEYPELSPEVWQRMFWKAPNGYAGSGNERRRREILYVKSEGRIES